MRAYPVAAEAMDLEIYILSALICGSENLRSLENELRGFEWLRSRFEASEISRRIIGLAVLLRNHLDITQPHPNTNVGSLIPDSESTNCTKPLSLREACNKIIHADMVDIHNDDQSSERNGAISNRIKLLGTYNGRQWIAEVDVLRFLNEASNHS